MEQDSCEYTFAYQELIALILLAIFLLPALRSARIDSNRSFFVARAEIWDVAAALNEFKSTYKEIPLTNSAEIFKALYGSNPKGIVFLSRGMTNTDGQMIDPWKMSYQIEILQQTNFTILSAGRDRKFGNKDDVIFNSVSNGFVKP